MSKKSEFKTNYFVIPLITIIVAAAGSYFSMSGMGWYDNELVRPDLAPPKWVFPVAWNTIFVLTTISALIIWNKGDKGNTIWEKLFQRKKIHNRYVWMVGLFISNAILNVLWSFLFFFNQLIGAALVEMIVLELTTLAIMVLSWRVSKWASVLLLPYLLWVGFATYLTYLIYTLN